MLTYRLTDLLFVTERRGVNNLRAEGVDDDRIHFVGNVMIDSLVPSRQKTGERTIRQDLGFGDDPYALMTMQRSSNVDDRERLLRVVEMMERGRRTWDSFSHASEDAGKSAGTWPVAARRGDQGAEVVGPLGYLDFLYLMEHAAVVVTDSGGIEEETTCLQVPCVTVRENTE